MHHLIYCFIFSYFTNRTLILKSDFWNYNKNGYEAYFKPVGRCNFSLKMFQDLVEWQGADLNKQKNILMPLIDFNPKRDKFWPQSLPKQLNNEIQRFHGKPFVIISLFTYLKFDYFKIFFKVWFIGQLASYLMRFNTQFSKKIKDKEKYLGFKRPCVG